MTQARSSVEFIPARLGLWDTVSIIVGIIIGVGIFKTPGDVFQNSAGPWQSLGVWALGGALSLIGALCFAELASTYPRSGGEYVYLTRAYGSGIGFLFAWAQLAVIRTGGGIAAVAYVFGESAARVWQVNPEEPVDSRATAVYAILAVAALSLINILGVNLGKTSQNILTLAKVVGIGLVVVAGLGAPAPATESLPVTSPPTGSFALAMIFVLWTYDGWNEATYVSSEVRNWRRNMPLALVLGTGLVTLIYLLYNVACLIGLGFEAARQPSAVLHRDLAIQFFGPEGGRLVLVLVMVSALGAVNGMIFTAARLYASMGSDHRLFAPLGWWNRRLQTPACSLLIQAGLAIAMIIAVGAAWRGKDGFDMLITCTAPVFWLFFLLTGVALFVLRWIDPDRERPFQVPLYPVLPVIFCSWCAYMLYGSLRHAHQQALVGLAVLLAGLPLWWLSRRLDRVPPPLDSQEATVAPPPPNQGDSLPGSSGSESSELQRIPE